MRCFIPILILYWSGWLATQVRICDFIQYLFLFDLFQHWIVERVIETACLCHYIGQLLHLVLSQALKERLLVRREDTLAEYLHILVVDVRVVEMMSAASRIDWCGTCRPCALSRVWVRSCAGRRLRRVLQSWCLTIAGPILCACCVCSGLNAVTFLWVLHTWLQFSAKFSHWSHSLR